MSNHDPRGTSPPVVASPVAASGQRGEGGVCTGICTGTRVQPEGGDRQTEINVCLSQNGEGVVTAVPSTLDDVLVAAGVYVGSRAKRLAIVEACTGHVEVDELQRACQFVLAAYPAEQRSAASAALAAILRDSEKRGEVLEDIRRHHALRGTLAVGAVAPAGRGHHDHGNAVRARDVAQVRRFDAAYDSWLADVRAGRVKPEWTPPSFMRRAPQEAT